ncbi:MAG: VTT domain-containing protein [Chloroflexi bacterium]|nr:VTT domain-containing protein [Chloroflexota bacterium]
MSVDTFGTYALPSILVLMLVKEAGVPLPIPSDLIMIAAGAQAAVGGVSLIGLVVAVEIAIIVGGTTQFGLARGPGRAFLYRYGRFLGLTRERLDGVSALFRRRGTLAVFLSLNVPGARAGAVAGAGLAGLSYRRFVPALIAGSTLFYAWHVALGYAIGPAAETVIANLSIRLAAGVIGLGVLGLLGWILLRRLRGVRGKKQIEPAPVLAWSEAACPGCLAATALRGLGKAERSSGVSLDESKTSASTAPSVRPGAPNGVR